MIPVNFTSLDSFVQASGPLGSCTDHNAVITWVNEVIKSEVAGCARYSHYLELGLFCALIIMVVIDWLGHIRYKKALALAEQYENELKGLKGGENKGS